MKRTLLVTVAALGAVAVLVVVLVFAGPLGPTAGVTVPHLVDESTTAGIDHVDGEGPTSYVGGGVAVFDCDDDGQPDVYLAGGSNPAALYHNDSPVGGALRFSRLSDPATDPANVEGAYPIDIDGDGTMDLAVLRVGGVDLLRGLGSCRFERANAAWSFDDAQGWSTALSATWEGGAALPTLAIGRYLELDPAGVPIGPCADNALYRPASAGGGYAPATVLTPGYCTLSMLFSDWDRSGRRDLRVTNDRHYYMDGQEQLWRIAPGEPPRQYTQADGWMPMQIWGMGIASYDVDGDGYPDAYLTSQGDNKLQTLFNGPAQPTYRDVALERGVNSATPFTGGDDRQSTAWHPEFADVNNDGFVDLFVSKGNVGAMPDYAARDPSDLFLGRPDGTFVQAADRAGIVSFARGRGAALADFNLDGMLDLVEVNLGEPVKVWRNVGSGDAGRPTPMGNWLALRITQPGPNRDGIGSWLEVRVGDRTTLRELTIGGGHVGGQLGWTHVGLGPATTATVRIQWPDGETGPWLPVTANEFDIIERGAAQVRRWQPPTS